MIDLTTEEVITMADAAKRLPTRPNIRTLYRWARVGVGGVKLRTIKVGSRVCTSAEALNDFCNRAATPDGADAVAAVPRSTSQRRRAAERAGRRLEARGA